MFITFCKYLSHESVYLDIFSRHEICKNTSKLKLIFFLLFFYRLKKQLVSEEELDSFVLESKENLTKAQNYNKYEIIP